MKILLTTTELDELQWAAERQWADGVYLSPGTGELGTATENGGGWLADASRIVGAPIYAGVRSIQADEMAREARDLARAGEQIIVVLPFVEDAVAVIRRLTSEGLQIAADYVFSGAQALLAAKAGAVAVIVPSTHRDAYGRAGLDVLPEVRAVLDGARMECDLVAGEPRTAAEFGECAATGVDAVAVSVTALRAFATHPLTDRGIDHYLNTAASRKRPQAV